MGAVTLAACRAAVIVSAAALAFYVFAAYDGFYVAQRFSTMRHGVRTSARVESLEPAPKGGLLQYRLTFSYDGPAGRARGEALVGEPARALVSRGRTLPARVLRKGALASAALDDDYGFTGQRVALLLALTSFLLVGAWSFAFRVL